MAKDSVVLHRIDRTKGVWVVRQIVGDEHTLQSIWARAEDAVGHAQRLKMEEGYTYAVEHWAVRVAEEDDVE